MNETQWKSIDSVPKDGTPVLARIEMPLRWRAYKPDARRQGYPEGRWQAMGEYGGWANIDVDPSEWQVLAEVAK